MKPPYYLQRPWFIILIAAGAAGFGGCAAVQDASYLKRQVASYAGDGQIQDISFRYLIFRIKGYELRFPVFNLDQPRSDTYTLRNLPVVGDYTMVYFAVNRVKNKQDIGSISFSIEDSDGVILARMDKTKLTEMIWSSGDEFTSFRIYDLDRSRFRPRKKKAYKLRFDYIPGSDSNFATGSIYIRCGGSI